MWQYRCMNRYLHYNLPSPDQLYTLRHIDKLIYKLILNIDYDLERCILR
jgi:hypothetical protein